MKKSRFTEARIMSVLRQAEGGLVVSELCRGCCQTKVNQFPFPAYPDRALGHEQPAPLAKSGSASQLVTFSILEVVLRGQTSVDYLALSAADFTQSPSPELAEFAGPCGRIFTPSAFSTAYAGGASSDPWPGFGPENDEETRTPAPSPFSIWIDDFPSDDLSVNVEMFLKTNPRIRKARAPAILRNLQREGSRCAWCREPVPLYRRADARFRCEGCRKRSARQRRVIWAEWRCGHLSKQ